MIRQIALLASLLTGFAQAAAPQPPASLLVRGATVHTLSAPDAAPLKETDVLVVDGRIAAIGRQLAAPAGARIIEARGKPLTPGLFGGLGHIGLEEIGLDPSTGDYAQRLNQMRPEFDVTLAYNPESMSLPIHRSNGITFAVIAPSTTSGSSIVAGLGAAVGLDGGTPPAARAMFVDLGASANALAGGSRAAQFMLLKQAVTEARAPNLVMVHDERLLTPAGRQVLLDFLKGAGPLVFDVDRAADIRQVIGFAQRENIRAIVRGGEEAWRLAPELAAAHIPVIVDPLQNLPQSLDAIGATLENAARLQAAGVTVALSMRSPDVYDAGKLRQAAGNAVAHGLPWNAGLAAITRTPAELFGVADRYGSLEKGRIADFVLWSGDPLDVTSLPELVVTGGREQSLQSRHTALRDRYDERLRRNAAR